MEDVHDTNKYWQNFKIIDQIYGGMKIIIHPPSNYQEESCYYIQTPLTIPYKN